MTDSTRPVFEQHRWRYEKNIILRLLARPDHWASVFFYLLRNVPLFRLTLEIVAVAALLATVFGVFAEYQERSKDRAVRGAMLLTQIGQLRPLSLDKRDAPLHAIIEALARDDFPLDRIDLSDMILHNLDLSGASLRGANFQNVQILNVNLRGADLQGANFGRASISGADFRDAMLKGANFGYAINIKKVDFRNSDLASVIFSYTVIDDSVLFRNAQVDNAYFVGTNLSKADLSTVRGLESNQLETACVMATSTPKLPTSVHWTGGSCK